MLRARDVLDYVLEDDDTPNGGTSKKKETVRQFISSTGMNTKISVRALNKTLVECGIKPITIMEETA